MVLVRIFQTCLYKYPHVCINSNIPHSSEVSRVCRNCIFAPMVLLQLYTCSRNTRSFLQLIINKKNSSATFQQLFKCHFNFHSPVLFLHVPPPPDVSVSRCCVMTPAPPGRVCACACACLCLSDPVFLSSLQSFSLHLVLIRTNSVEVSGCTAGLTLSPLRLPTFIFIPRICISCVSCRFSVRTKR